MIKSVIKDLCPPLIWRGLSDLKAKVTAHTHGDGTSQDLAIYWNPQMAMSLETWGERHTWLEIQMFLWDATGKVLDIACGTGKVMEIFQSRPDLNVHGCDISDFLLSKAAEKGIPKEKLVCCDATEMPYPENSFDYGYSIGSLEHFSEEGILAVFRQCHKIVRKRSFHMVCISRSGANEGWISPHQSYWNNTIEWWQEKGRAVFPKVQIIQSAWEDRKSIGIWVVLEK